MDGRSGGGGGGDNRAGWQGGNYDATNQIKQLLGIVENDVGKEVPRTPPRNTQGDLGGGPRTPSRNNRGDVGKQAKTPPRNMHNDTRSSPRNSQPQNIPYNSHRQHLNDNRSGSPYRHQRDSNRYDGRHHYGSPSHHHGQSRYGHYNHYGSPRNHRDYNINGPRHGTPPTESSINSEESPDYKPSSEDLSKLEEQFLFPLKKRSIRFPKARYFCRLCDYHCDSMAVCRRHMADNRHQKLKDARDAETTLKNVPCPTPAHIVAIDALVKSIAEEYQVTPEMRQQRFDVVEELSNLLDAKAIGCRLDLVGSTLSCFALKTSDVNVDIVMESGLNISTALLAVKELVTKNDNYSDVLDDLCSAFPTMSVTHVTTGLRLVVGAGSVCSKMTNQLLGDYSSLDERVPILGVVFRRWAQLCHIDEQPKGTLPAHAFPIMVVHFLQQHRVPILPVLHQFVQNPDGETYLRPSEFDKKWTSSNCLSVGELWLDMFRFYAIGFKMADLVINIRQHQPMSRAEKTWNKKIAIEDPFQQKRTLSRTVSGNPVFEYITDRFKVTYKYFAIPQMKMGPIFNHIVVKETCHSASEGSSEYETDKAEDEMDDDDSEEEKDSPGPILHNLISHLKIQENEAEQDTSNNIADHEDDNLIPILEDLRSTLSLVTPSVAQKLYKQVTTDHLKFRFDANCFTGGSLPPLICGSCQKEGHCKAECQEDDLPPLIELPPTSKAFIQQLTSIFEQLTRDFEPTKDEIDDRDMIVADLEKYITSANGFSGARLQLFGSSANGFGFQRSDLDICLTFDGDATGQDVNHIKIIEKLAERLKRYRQCQHVFAITTAKVPIVKFSIRRRDHLEGDLSLYNTLALQNTKLLATYAKIDHRVKCLGYAMKYFAKLCDIGDASRGSLSSYAYILMVLHFLQHTTPPVIPVLQELYDQSKTAPKLIIDGWNAWFFDNVNNLSSVWPDHGKNKETLGELWIGMLKYYTETFNWKENVVTIKQFAPLTRLEKLWNSRCIVIEDPFDLNHNLGAGLSRKMNTFIMKAFIRGREIFGTPMTNLPPGCRNLVDYLFDNKNLTDGAPPNDRGCRYCGKIGHIQRDCPKKKINQEKKEKREKQKDRKERRQYEEDRLEDERHKQKEDMKLNERVGVSTSTSPSNNREDIRTATSAAMEIHQTSGGLTSRGPTSVGHTSSQGQTKQSMVSTQLSPERSTPSHHWERLPSVPLNDSGKSVALNTGGALNKDTSHKSLVDVSVESLQQCQTVASGSCINSTNNQINLVSSTNPVNTSTKSYMFTNAPGPPQSSSNTSYNNANSISSPDVAIIDRGLTNHNNSALSLSNENKGNVVPLGSSITVQSSSVWEPNKNNVVESMGLEQIGAPPIPPGFQHLSNALSTNSSTSAQAPQNQATYNLAHIPPPQIQMAVKNQKPVQQLQQQMQTNQSVVSTPNTAISGTVSTSSHTSSSQQPYYYSISPADLFHMASQATAGGAVSVVLPSDNTTNRTQVLTTSSSGSGSSQATSTGGTTAPPPPGFPAVSLPLSYQPQQQQLEAMQFNKMMLGSPIYRLSSPASQSESSGVVGNTTYTSAQSFIAGVGGTLANTMQPSMYAAAMQQNSGVPQFSQTFGDPSLSQPPQQVTFDGRHFIPQVTQGVHGGGLPPQGLQGTAGVPPPPPGLGNSVPQGLGTNQGLHQGLSGPPPGVPQPGVPQSNIASALQHGIQAVPMGHLPPQHFPQHGYAQQGYQMGVGSNGGFYSEFVYGDPNLSNQNPVVTSQNQGVSAEMIPELAYQRPPEVFDAAAAAALQNVPPQYLAAAAAAAAQSTLQQNVLTQSHPGIAGLSPHHPSQNTGTAAAYSPGSIIYIEGDRDARQVLH